MKEVMKTTIRCRLRLKFSTPIVMYMQPGSTSSNHSCNTHITIGSSHPLKASACAWTHTCSTSPSRCILITKIMHSHTAATDIINIRNPSKVIRKISIANKSITMNQKTQAKGRTQKRNESKWNAFSGHLRTRGPISYTN